MKLKPFRVAREKSSGEYFYERNTGWGHVAETTSDIMRADRFEKKSHLVYAIVRRGREIKDYEIVKVYVTIEAVPQQFTRADFAQEKRELEAD